MALFYYSYAHNLKKKQEENDFFNILITKKIIEEKHLKECKIRNQKYSNIDV